MLTNHKKLDTCSCYTSPADSYDNSLEEIILNMYIKFGPSLYTSYDQYSLQQPYIYEYIGIYMTIYVYI